MCISLSLYIYIYIYMRIKQHVCIYIYIYIHICVPAPGARDRRPRVAEKRGLPPAGNQTEDNTIQYDIMQSNVK